MSQSETQNSPHFADALVIVGHPRRDSFNGALAEAYAQGIRDSGGTVELIYLGDLSFDALVDPTQRTGPLEADLVGAQEKILKATHLAFVFPTWWGTFPALLKGFVDRCFLSGFAFRMEKGKMLPMQLLKGRTGRILVTMDAPTFYYRWFQGAPGVSAIKGGTLKFCGVKMLGTSLFGQIQSRNPDQMKKYLVRAAADGKKDGLRVVRA